MKKNRYINLILLLSIIIFNNMLVMEIGYNENINEKNEQLQGLLAQLRERDPNTNLRELFSSIANLVKEGADINTKDFYGNTVLYYAVKFGIRRATLYFINKGAQIDGFISQENGLTLLMQAVVNYDLWMVRTLVDKGADPNARNNEGLSALSIAMSMRIRDNEIIDFLESKYGKPRVVTKCKAVEI